jgi:high-affinity nickel-transport protein
MIGASAFAVFALGLRHGADPDHLAAIDNLTRNSAQRRSPVSRYVGTLFAGGHALMVLAVAALVGLLGSRFAAGAPAIETAGTWISVAVLLLLAVMNLRQLASGRTDRIAGAKLRLLPGALRDGSNPWLAVPVGLLFGIGFETSSQIAAYALAFGTDAGAFGALAVGSMFCLGMVCTDTLDSLLVHRLVTYRADRLPHVMRVWIWSVTLLALAVAAYELLQLAGAHPPLTDLTMSAVLVSLLALVFAWIFHSTRSIVERGSATMERSP